MKKTTDKTTPRTTWTSLAHELGHSRGTFAIWRRQPGAPQDPDPEAWLEYITEHRLGGDGNDAELMALRAEKLREEIQTAKMRNARLRGETLPAAAVEAFVGTLAQKWDLLLRQKLETESGARCAGKSAGAINAEGAAILDEIREVCAAGLNEWKRIDADA